MTMDNDKRQRLEALGWPTEILDSVDKPNPAAEEVDRMFRDQALKALAEVGYVYRATDFQFTTLHTGNQGVLIRSPSQLCRDSTRICSLRGAKQRRPMGTAIHRHVYDRRSDAPPFDRLPPGWHG